MTQKDFELVNDACCVLIDYLLDNQDIQSRVPFSQMLDSVRSLQTHISVEWSDALYSRWNQQAAA